MEQEERRAPDGDAVEPPLSSFSTYHVSPKEAFKMIETARQTCPAVRSDQLGGFKILTGYEDIRRAAVDWRQFSSKPSALRPVNLAAPGLAIDSDPPEHTLRRSIIALVLDDEIPGRIEQPVREDISHLLDSLEDRDECDLVEDFAEQVPLRAICHLFGFSPDQGPEIRRLAVELLASRAEPERSAAASRAFQDFSVAAVVARRGGNGQDPLTRIANAEVNGQPLNSNQISSLLIGLLTAGHETAVSGLTSLLYQTLSRPEVRDRLVAEPERIPMAVEEALRINPPIFGMYRRATHDTEISGVDVAQDETVYLCWAAANRDPEVFEDPQAYRLDRTGKRHMAFGFGTHKCPGAPVARMEMELALTDFLRRFPKANLIDPKAVTHRFGGTETMAIRSLPARLR